jgi:hypothetical protein
MTIKGDYVGVTSATWRWDRGVVITLLVSIDYSPGAIYEVLQFEYLFPGLLFAWDWKFQIRGWKGFSVLFIWRVRECPDVK